MRFHCDDIIFESTGRRMYAYCGDVALSPLDPGRLGYGWDGHAGDGGGDASLLTDAERREVADYMVALWNLWAATEPATRSEGDAWPPEGFAPSARGEHRAARAEAAPPEPADVGEVVANHHRYVLRVETFASPALGRTMFRATVAAGDCPEHLRDGNCGTSADRALRSLACNLLMDAGQRLGRGEFGLGDAWEFAPEPAAKPPFLTSEWANRTLREGPDDPGVPLGGVRAGTSLRTSACAIIRDADGRVAAIRSRKHGGKLQLPGGKSEPGETPEANARRETLEEVGLHIDDLTPILYSECGGFACTTFVVDGWRGRLCSSDEGEAVWVTHDELLAHGVYPDHTRRWIMVLASPSDGMVDDLAERPARRSRR